MPTDTPPAAPAPVRLFEAINAINAWRIEDGKRAVIDAWYRAGRRGRFPVWAWENRRGKFWQAEVERRALASLRPQPPEAKP